MKTKYIIFEENHLEDIIIFSGLQFHNVIARGFNKIVSAGFIEFTPLEDYVRCYGKSISLKLEARPEEDEKIARRALGMDNDD